MVCWIIIFITSIFYVFSKQILIYCFVILINFILSFFIFWVIPFNSDLVSKSILFCLFLEVHVNINDGFVGATFIFCNENSSTTCMWCLVNGNSSPLSIVLCLFDIGVIFFDFFCHISFISYFSCFVLCLLLCWFHTHVVPINSVYYRQNLVIIVSFA